MPKYTLHYFNLRARGEVMRLLFAAADVEYEDNRIPFAEWPKNKERFPFRQVPVLEVDGKLLSQGQAMARYLANQFGFAGKNPWEAAEADMYAGAVEDLFMAAVRFFFEKDETRKAEYGKAFKEEKGPAVLQAFEKALDKNPSGYLVGDGLTYADLAFFAVLDFLDDTLGSLSSEVLSNYPNVAKHRKKIQSLPKIAAWISKRPKSDR